MLYLYPPLLAVIALMMTAGSIIETKRNNSPQGKIIRNLLAFGAASLLAYAAGMSVPGLDPSIFFYTIYFCMSDWLIISLLEYCVNHSHLPRFDKFYKHFKFALIIFAAADNIAFIANFFTHSVFVCREITDRSQNVLLMPDTVGQWFLVHSIFIVFAVSLGAAALVYRALTTPRLYRFRVISVLVIMLLITGVNIMEYICEIYVDLSLCFYSVLALVIFYYSILYTPKSLIDRLLTIVAKNMEGFLTCFDIDGKCVFANEAALRLFGAEGRDGYKKISEGFHRWLKGHPQSEVDDFSWRSTHSIRGTDYHFNTQFKKLFDKKGNYIGNFFLMTDETKQVKKMEEERYQATHDELTGLYNKKYFMEKVSERLKNAKSGEYCIVSTDVRDFKLINDMFGVEKGDEVLIAIAETIRHLAKEGTVYGRINSDRYCIFMPTERYTDELLINEIERLSGCISKSNYQVRIHSGVYVIKNPSMDVSVAIDRANMALRSIKDSYTEVIAHYNEKLREIRIREQKITADFDRAIEGGQFNIFLQPQISVGGETLGAEALVRWMHPERGIIPPDEFIGVFERTGLIAGMDRYVWELACKQLNNWKREGQDKFHISVNISPKDFYFTDIYGTFTELIDKYEISPKNLRLEITETAIMSDLKKQLSLIDRLRSFGFAVEMDDFGSGYSSLNMLKDINVDTLKIDMGFLRRTESSNKERSIAIINTIISLSKQLGMEVITEGVETREQVDFLTNAGCDIFQGYYFAKPMNISDFEKAYFK